MPSIEGKVALVTGASSGIGAETVLRLRKAGATVYAAARRVERMRQLEAAGIRLLALDITDEASIQRGLDEIQATEKGVDILVNNAGYGCYGAVEDVPIAEARCQFEVNIFGLARLTQLLLPYMRSQGCGRIVNISSIGGKIYTPMGGWYHASKFALEALSDCMRLELEPFGVDVIVVEPGGIVTEWGGIAAENLQSASKDGPYSLRAEQIAAEMQRMYGSGKTPFGGRMSPPSAIAEVILRAVRARRPQTRYAAGAMSGFMLTLRKLLSDRAFDRLLRSASGQ